MLNSTTQDFNIVYQMSNSTTQDFNIVYQMLNFTTQDFNIVYQVLKSCIIYTYKEIQAEVFSESPNYSARFLFLTTLRALLAWSLRNNFTNLTIMRR